MEIKETNGRRYYSGDITPGENVVFVFGSNPEGRHGAGAARVARERFGAVYGQGEGLQGNAYALPTKDLRVTENNGFRSISEADIIDNISRLYETARQNPNRDFFIAYRNTTQRSLNGYTGTEMMRMFVGAGRVPDNVIFSEEWHDAGMENLMTDAVAGAEKKAVGEHKPDKTSNLSPALQVYVRTPEFKAKYGDWENGKSDLILDENGEPKILWHGSSNSFDSFDMSRAGENTGIVEYTDRKTGEKVNSDSEKAVFFSNDRSQAISYAILSYTHKLSTIKSDLFDMAIAFETLKAKKGWREQFNRIRNFDGRFAELLDGIDLSGERPVSRIPEERRLAIAKAMNAARVEYEKAFRHGESNMVGSPLSNEQNNISRQMEYFDYFSKNIERIRRNDFTVMGEYLVGEKKDLSEVNVHFFDGRDRFSSGVSIHSMDGRLKMNTRFIDEMSEEEVDHFLDDTLTGLNACADKFNATLKETGYGENIRLYPAFLRMGNPLEHDYQHSAFPDVYKPNPKYGTAYVAARQNARAHEEGYDGVIYRNIMDPHNSDTYGVFSTEQIVMIDPKLMKAEDMTAELQHFAPKKDNIYFKYEQEMKASVSVEAEDTAFRLKAEKALASGVFTEVGEMKDGWARVRHTKGLYNYAGQDGKFLTKNWFKEASEFNRGKATVTCADSTRCVIDTTGTILEVTRPPKQTITVK